MKKHNNFSVNLHKFNSEQRRQHFLALIDTDPTLPNMLNSEQRHRLYAVLVAIDSTLAEPLLDARSAVRGVINKQFPKGSTMNLIKPKEYEEYKDTQKKLRKNRNGMTSRFLHSEPLSRQTKGKAKEVIKEFNEANPTFLVSETDFILRDWLTSYCNSMVDQEKKKKITNARAKGLALPPVKKNVHPPIQRRNASHVDIESTSDMDDQNDMNNHDNMDYQDDMDEADEMFGHTQDFDTSIPVIKATKNVNKTKKGKVSNAKQKKYALSPPKKNTQPSVQRYSNYVNDTISHAQNPGLVTRNDYDIESTGQDDIDDSNTLASIINILLRSKKSDRSLMQDITNSENDDNTQDFDTSVSVTNALLPLKSSRSSYSIKKPNINQDTLTPIMSLLKKSLRSSAQRQNGIEDTLKQNDTIENNTQNTLKQNKQNGIVKNNTQYASTSNNTNKINTRTKNLQSSQNHNGIKDVSKQNSIVKNNTQGSSTSDSIGKKRKGEQKAKEMKARVNKKTKTNEN
ncbi:29356_t:CDS:2 [Gigaspora margarita]|uniref:29356_t:CDS:1 n=1 Tax=Gigaspora margarita TaxID=4874 RepID=A0ABN7WBT8_GIGMA|nr:29356_t:CDS:2 [Gigaspora margarita]